MRYNIFQTRPRPASRVFQQPVRANPLIAAALVLLLGCLNFPKAEGTEPPPPKVDHILLEVSDLKASIAFYHGLMGLRIKSEDGEFVTMEAANMGVFLWSKRWGWEAPKAKNERQGLGMYPHFAVPDAEAVVSRARQAGYIIVQEPKRYRWGTEAFVADPDGYIWALISPP